MLRWCLTAQRERGGGGRERVGERESERERARERERDRRRRRRVLSAVDWVIYVVKEHSVPFKRFP